MEQNLNLNHNLAECLQKINNIGSTTFQNVCNGKSAVVPWGNLDWIGAGFMGIICGVVVGLFLGLMWALWRLR